MLRGSRYGFLPAGVVVRQDGEYAKPRGRKTGSPDPPRHEQRYGGTGSAAPAANDGTLGRSWHEASVATLAFFDPEGTRQHDVRRAHARSGQGDARGPAREGAAPRHGGQTVMTFCADLLSNCFEALHREPHASYTNVLKDAA